jgi:hypothetical protein
MSRPWPVVPIFSSLTSCRLSRATCRMYVAKPSGPS